MNSTQTPVIVESAAMVPAATTALTQMGFEVYGMRYGVYRLRRFDGSSLHRVSFDGVGLLLSAKPLTESKDALFFFEYNLLADLGQDATANPMAYSELLDRWGRMDARRLAESGVAGVSLPWSDDTFGEIIQPQFAIERTDAGHFRHAALTSSGDVICYT